MPFFIKGDFYFDIDHLNQLRITGPQNHLLLGVTFPIGVKLEVQEYEIFDNQLEITLATDATTLELTTPIVADIRTLRGYTEGTIPHPTYAELVRTGVTDILPRVVKSLTEKGNQIFEFTNSYEDEPQQELVYGSRILLSSRYAVRLQGYDFVIQSPKPISMVIRTVTNIPVMEKYTAPVFTGTLLLPPGLPPFIKNIYQVAGEQIEHLVKAKKTSSFEYGTIFPRDWIESADLGLGDFSPETVDYMYRQSMNYVSESGEGWHEEVIGEYKKKVADTSRHIDRKMIDIEPRYIMGMKRVSKQFLIDPVNQHRLRLVANFLLANAQKQEVITFKKISEDGEEFFNVGNWRDSAEAFPFQKTPLAPYDVNCVFYPVSLKIIFEFSEFFRIKAIEPLLQLISKWDENKLRFRLYHPGNTLGYALALHRKKMTPIPVAHLDESYDLFYNQPSLEEVVSFAKKVMDPDFFYTPVGPLLVASDEEEFSTREYHGKVIWPKQAAYAVAGLVKQYKNGQKVGWPEEVLGQIKQAGVFTAEACFKGWEDLRSVPELYYYDASAGRARFFTDQENFKGQMSYIQLWSSVGARRIVRDYLFLQSET